MVHLSAQLSSDSATASAAAPPSGSLEWQPDALRLPLVASLRLCPPHVPSAALSEHLLAMCIACLEDVPLVNILACPPEAVPASTASAAAPAAAEARQHNICVDCLQRHVVTVDAIEVDRNGGQIPCPALGAAAGCPSPGWAIGGIAGRIDEATLGHCTRKLARLADVACAKRAFEAELQVKLDRGLACGPHAHATRSPSRDLASSGAAGAFTHGPAVGGFRAHASDSAPAPPPTAEAQSLATRAALLADVIRERDLTLRCPRCAAPFAEVHGDSIALCRGGFPQATGPSVGDSGACFCGVCCREFPSVAASHGPTATTWTRL